MKYNVKLLKLSFKIGKIMLQLKGQKLKIIITALMRIGHNAVRWTLKRYVINNRAIKFGRRSSKNECHFAARSATFHSADGQYISLILLTPFLPISTFSLTASHRKFCRNSTAVSLSSAHGNPLIDLFTLLKFNLKLKVLLKTCCKTISMMLSCCCWSLNH